MVGCDLLVCDCVLTLTVCLQLVFGFVISRLITAFQFAFDLVAVDVFAV